MKELQYVNSLSVFPCSVGGLVDTSMVLRLIPHSSEVVRSFPTLLMNPTLADNHYESILFLNEKLCLTCGYFPRYKIADDLTIYGAVSINRSYFDFAGSAAFVDIVDTLLDNSLSMLLTAIIKLPTNSRHVQPANSRHVRRLLGDSDLLRLAFSVELAYVNGVLYHVQLIFDSGDVCTWNSFDRGRRDTLELEHGALTRTSVKELMNGYCDLMQTRSSFWVLFDGRGDGGAFSVLDKFVERNLDVALLPFWKRGIHTPRDYNPSAPGRLKGLKIHAFVGPRATIDDQIEHLKCRFLIPRDAHIVIGPADHHTDYISSFSMLSSFESAVRSDELSGELHLLNASWFSMFTRNWRWTIPDWRRSFSLQAQDVVEMMLVLRVWPLLTTTINDIFELADVGWRLFDLDRLRLIQGTRESCCRVYERRLVHAPVAERTRDQTRAPPPTKKTE